MPAKELEILVAEGRAGQDLTPSEITNLAVEMSGIMDYVERMDEVDSAKIGHNIKYIFDKITSRE